MKLKKILAAVAAAAVAVSTMAVNAFAGLTNYPDGCTIDLIADGYNVMDVYGFTFNISGSINDGVGGGVGFNSASTGWESHEWGNPDSAKEILVTDGKVTLLKDAPVFKETDVTDPSNPYAQVWMQHWWGVDVTVDSVDILGAGGTVLSPAGAADDAAPADDTTADDNTAVADEAAPADDNTSADADVADDDADADIVDTDDDEDVDDDAADDVADTADNTVVVTSDNAAPAADTTTAAAATGNVAVASIVAVMAVAGAAAIVSKKRQ